MAVHYEEQETNQPIPVVHRELSADTLITPTLVKPFEFTGLREQVDEIIDRGFSDMWLLIDGEEFERDFASGIWRDGQPFAMVTGGQVSLLGPRFSALNALLSVGVSMR